MIIPTVNEEIAGETVTNNGSVVVARSKTLRPIRSIESHHQSGHHSARTSDQYTTINKGKRKITNNQSVIPEHFAYGKEVQAPENRLAHVFPTSRSSEYTTMNYGKQHITNNHARYGKAEIQGSSGTSHAFETHNQGCENATYNDQDVVQSKGILQSMLEFLVGFVRESDHHTRIEGAPYSFHTTNTGNGNFTKNG